MEALRIDPEFQNKIPPIGADEFKQLEENILEAGEVYEPIVVWNGIIVDGHNRWKIIQQHPEIKWRTHEMEFADKWAAFDWMYKNQLGRRNLTDEQRTYTIGKMLEARKHTMGGDRRSEEFSAGQNDRLKKSHKDIKAGTAGEIGKEIGIGEKNVRRAEHFANGVDALREVSPEAADKVLSGKAGVTKTQVQEIRNMEPEAIKEKAKEILNDGEKPKPKKPAQDGTVRKNFGNSAEGRALKETIKQAYAPLVDASLGVAYNLDDLIEELTIIGDTCARHLHQAIEIRRSIIPEEAKVTVQNVIRSIARKIDQEVHQV